MLDALYWIIDFDGSDVPILPVGIMLLYHIESALVVRSKTPSQVPRKQQRWWEHSGQLSVFDHQAESCIPIVAQPLTSVSRR